MHGCASDLSLAETNPLRFEQFPVTTLPEDKYREPSLRSGAWRRDGPMVVDRSELTRNLTKFYDFEGKTVLYVGAGGGQLLSPLSGVKSVVAIDSNPDSLEGFRREVKTKWAGISVRFVPRSFEAVDLRGDVVYFEFCLHQMKSPAGALEHASSLASDIVVMDHLPNSEWVYYWAGEPLVLRSTKAIESFGVRRRRRFTAEQIIEGYDALAARLSGLGEESRRRILKLKGTRDITIRMDYGLFLLPREGEP